MYKIFYSVIIIIWILDILNFSFMSFMDVKVPINELAWMLIFIFLPDVD